MLVSNQLQASRYLRTVRRTDDNFSMPGGQLAEVSNGRTVIYHSLFGRARMVDAETVALLRWCHTPRALEAVAAKVSAESLNALSSLSFLVPAGTDEIQSIEEELRIRRKRLSSGVLLSSLQLVVTNACNFNCSYCFAYNFEQAVASREAAGNRVRNARASRKLPLVTDKVWNRNPHEKARNPTGQMSPETAELALRRAIEVKRRNGGGTLSVSFFGGEPTLNRDLILHVLRTFGDGSAHGVALEYELTTNGSRLDQALQETLAAYKVGVIVSVDYLTPAGEYRGGADTGVPWRDIDDSIASLRKRGVRVRLSSVLSEATWPYWGNALTDYAASVGIGELNVVVSLDRAFFESRNPKVVADRLLAAFDYGQQHNVLLTGYWYHTYLLIVDEGKYQMQADYKTCPAIGRMLSIEPNGAIYACKVTNKQIGDLSSFDQLFGSDPYADYAMRAYVNSPMCHHCELEGSCSGGSAGGLEEQTGSIKIMNPSYCEYIRHVIHGLLRRHTVDAASLFD